MIANRTHAPGGTSPRLTLHEFIGIRSIVALDPGPNHTAAAALRNDGGIARIELEEAIENEDISIHGHAIVICEDIEFQGKRITIPAVETAKWIGRFNERAEAARAQFILVRRSDAYNHLMASYRNVAAQVRSPEARIRRAVDLRLEGLGMTALDMPGNHARSAVAVLLYWLHRQLT